MIDLNEPTGLYPLHTALLRGHEWEEGVKELVHSAPQVLRLSDSVSGLYPFQMVSARATNVDGRRADDGRGTDDTTTHPS